MDENSKAAIQVDPKEIFFLVAKFLEASPCQEAAKVLRTEIDRHQLLPSAKNWLGQERPLTYGEVEERYVHVGSQHLGFVCSKFLNLLEHHGYQRTTGLKSLLGSGVKKSVCGDAPCFNKKNSAVLKSAGDIAHRWKELLQEHQEQPQTNLCNLVLSRAISTKFPANLWRSPWLYERLRELHTILGHLAAVFCVLFDHTGQRVITGADDDLVKVWSSRSGQLLATLRGHSAEVTDISLSADNSMIATGSLDKTVRVWCARSSAPIAVLLGHQGHVTSVQFSPAADEECRYLASTGKGGYLCFWSWLPDQEMFSPSPIKFMEKNRMGDQTLCSAFSAGGKYFVTGGTDHILRVYLCIPDSPTLHAELEGHKGRIMSIQFGHTGEAVFATASCDSTARVWRYVEGKWTSTVLEVPANEINCKQANEKPQVTMIGWEKTDSYVVTAFSPDCIIRVWASSNGRLVQKLEGHTGEVFVLEMHPSDSRVLLTAGHDGLVLLWDMLSGQQLQRVEVKGDDDSPASIFDCRFSPDGLMCAAVDMNGFLTLMGFGSSDQYDKHPREQFFHTDYRPLMRDSNHYVVDEQSQLPPHLLPPPYMVDIDGHAHPVHVQEALLRLIRPHEEGEAKEQSTEELEDYDDYMKKKLALLGKREQQGLGWFGRQKLSSRVGVTGSGGGGCDKEPVAGGCDKEPVAGGCDKEPAAGGSDKEPVAVGCDKEPVAGGCDKEPVAGGSGTCLTEAAESLAGVEDSEMVVDSCKEDGQQDLGGHGEEGGSSGSCGEMNNLNALACGTVRATGETTSSLLKEKEEEVGLAGGRRDSSEGQGQLKENGQMAINSEMAVNGEVAGEVEADTDAAKIVKISERERFAEESMSNGGSVVKRRTGGESEGSGDGGRSQGEESVQGGREEVVEVLEEEGRNVSNMLSSLVYSLGLGEAETKKLISFWHSRVIIPPFGPAQLAQSLARRQELYRREQENFEQENEKARLREEQAVAPAEECVVRGRALRSGRTLPSTSEGTGSLDRESVAMDVSEEEDERESELERAWDASSYDSSDISDWTEEVGIDISRILRRRTKKRKKSVESVLSNTDLMEEEEEEEEEDGEEGGEGGSGRDRKSSTDKQAGRRKGISKRRLLDLEAYAPPAWITNTKPVLSPYLPQVGDIVVYFQQGHQQYAESVKEQRLYPIHRSAMPWHKFSLHPQEFCQVTNVRFAVGPPTLCSVTLALLHPLNRGMDPDNKGQESGEGCQKGEGLEQQQQQQQEEEEEACHGGAGGSTARHKDRIRFTFKFHDMDSVLDFVILEQLYKMAVCTSWEVGDKFRSLIDSKYWYGVIKEKRPYSKEYPNSFWQCFHVLWDDGATDSLSPWDMEPIPQQESPPDNTTSLPDPDVKDEPSSGNKEEQDAETPTKRRERRCSPDNTTSLPDPDVKDEPSSGNEEKLDAETPSKRRGLPDNTTSLPDPDVKDEPSSGKEQAAETPISSRLSELLTQQQEGERDAWEAQGEVTRILSGLEQATKLDEAAMFQEPVDLEQVPEYCTVVPFPTDLKTIVLKLKNGLYRRKRALLWELMLIAKNAVAFNEEDSLIVKHARVLVHTLGQFIKSPGVSDLMGFYTPEAQGEVEDDVGVALEEEVVLVDPLELPPSPDFPTDDQEKKSPPAKPASSLSLASGTSAEDTIMECLWLEKASQLLSELAEHEMSEPFLEPVDTDQYMDYPDFVREPMDFSTIEKKLSEASYVGPQEFVSDFRLVFSNSRLYNRRGSEMYRVTSEIQSFFEKKLPQYFQGYISHPYKTRNAAGKLPDAVVAANVRSSSTRTSSTSSMEDSSFTASYRNKNRGRHAERRRLHRAARESTSAIVPATRRSQRNITKTNSLATSGTEDEEDEVNDEGSDASSCRSNSVSSGSIASSSILQTTARKNRIQTRSMRKESSAAAAPSQQVSSKLKNSSVGSMNKDNFTMTLRVRSSLKRKKFYTSGEESSEEEEEMQEEDEDEDDKGDGGMEEAMDGEDCSSEEQSADEVMRKRSCRIKAKSTVFTHTGRHLRKRPRTRYFEDEEERI